MSRVCWSCSFVSLYLVLHFQILHFLVLHFRVLTFGPAFSGPAFSGPAFSAPPTPPLAVVVKQIRSKSQDKMLALISFSSSVSAWISVQRLIVTCPVVGRAPRDRRRSPWICSKSPKRKWMVASVSVPRVRSRSHHDMPSRRSDRHRSLQWSQSHRAVGTAPPSSRFSSASVPFTAHISSNSPTTVPVPVVLFRFRKEY